MWSHRTAIDEAAVVEAYLALCQPVPGRAQRQARGLCGFCSGFDTSRGMPEAA